jgi:Ig-like domain from next to BRCA1 gene
MRQLGYAMEQIRNAVGLRLDPLDLLNRAIIELYPEVEGRPDGRAGPVSVPRLLRTTHLLEEVEQGKREPNRDRRPWLEADPDPSADQIRSNPIPAWLVRAYDLAFGADGYLVDLYRWAVAVDAAHAQAPPRLTTVAPAAVPAAELRAVLAWHFPDAGAEVSALLDAYAAELTARSRRPEPRPGPAWSPHPADESVIDDDGTSDFPEGLVLLPGQTRVIRWEFRNIGTVSWMDRVLARIGHEAPGGLLTPPYVPIPDTEPGRTCVVTCPIRAPGRSGTVRACFKMAWPDGTLCYPTTLIGALASVIVPPAELIADWRAWPAG